MVDLHLEAWVNFLIVVFALSGYCRIGPSHRNFLVYYDIATVCSGLAIEISKSEVNHFEIDDQSAYEIITAASSNVTLSVATHLTIEETSTWVPNVKAIERINSPPGTYTATVRGSTDTSVYIVGRTDFIFKHGFSNLVPKTINDTTPQPFADTETHLSISVTDSKPKVKIQFAQLLDENDEPLLFKLPLKRISRNFYVTTPFKAPSVKFRIAVHGKVAKTGRGITRKNKILIVPGNIKPKTPVVNILEGSSTQVEYGQTIKLTCKVSAYPEPKIEWYNNHGEPLESESSLIGEQYEYISYLTITEVTKNDTYSCKATNNVGETVMAVDVIPKDPFTITSVPKDVTELPYGMRGALICDIKAAGPMHISWYFEDKTTGVSKPLITSDKYTISNDGTTLNINKMNLEMVGKYTCKAVLDKQQNKFTVHETRVQVTGLISPSIITSPLVYEGIEGIKQLTIPCQAIGLPDPRITWKVNGNIISTNTKFSVEEEALVIKDPKVTDSASYTCEAQNEVDTARTSFRADIRQLPEVLGENEVIAIKGLPVKLECEVVKGVPKPTMSWQFKANAVSTFESLPVYDAELQIPSVGVEHAGSYKCVAHNVVGNSEHITTLTVHVPPTIIASPSAYEGIEMRDRVLKIHCNATGIPKPIIRWKVNGAIITPNNKFSIKEGTLVIEEPKVEDSGTFLCEAQNDANTARATFRADIWQLPEVFAGDENKAIKGQPFKLICKTLKGVPKPTISWQFKSNAASKFKTLPVYDEVLHIPNVGLEHEGTYKCVAHNVVGDGEHITTLTVLGPPMITASHSVYEAVETRDRELKIPCNVTGVPKPAITWKVKGEIISSNTKYAIEDETLVIKEPKVEDSDTYTCEAQNGVDTATIKFQVDIYQFPLLFGVNKKIAIKSQPVNIECKVIKGVPQPTIYWEFKPTGASTFEPLQIHDNVLHIPRVGVQNAGSYKCIAHNLVGEVELITTLAVHVPPNIISNSSVVEGVEARDRELKIPCKATGIPEPNVTWKVKGAIITPNLKFSIEDGTLVIKEPKVTDSETFTCEAQNDADTAHATFRVEIRQLPEASAQDEITATKGLPVNLECAAIKGVPKPTISWEFKRNDVSEFKPLQVYDNVLRIPSAGVQHTGSYKCVAHNVVGDSDHITKLIVHVPPAILSSSYVYEAVETKDQVLNIPCKTSGIPKPIVTWKFNGVIISSNAKYTTEEDTLIIKEPKVVDSGSYTCEAKNIVDIDRATFRAVIRQVPELFGENEKIAIKGQPVNLECNALKGVPEPTITWQFKRNTAKTFELLPITDNVLRIPNVGLQLAGSYKCLAHNIAGDGEHITTLHVYDSPTIISSPSVYEAVESRDWVLTIPCKVTGVPKPNITWKVKGAIIKSNAKFSIEDGNMVIKDPEVADSGIYTCEAQNAVDTVSATFRAYIKQIPELSGENETIAIKGRPVSLVCKLLKGVPKPKMSWQFKSDTASAFEVLTKHTDVLLIPHVGVEHAGTYKCVAHNAVGKSEHITVLKVLVPPTIILKPLVYEAVETRDRFLKIPCKVTDTSNVTFTWKVKGTIVSPDTKFSMKEGTLVIKEPKVADSEWYTCEATNDAGAVHAMFLADIHQLPEASGVNEKIAIKGQPVEFECKALKGVPKPTISWKFKHIAASKYKLLSGFDEVIRVLSVGEQHAGSYKCVAHNVVGDAVHITTLTVHVPPKIISNPSSYEGVEKQDRLLKILCVATGIPKPTITWKVKGANILANSTKIAVEDGNLVIKEPKVADSENYTCEAHNDVDNARATFRVIINQLPEVYAEELKIAIKGQPINLICETLKGVPEPMISWQFQSNSARTFEPTSVNSNVFNISSADVRHAGSYKCVAHNVVGDDEHITTLSVFVPPIIASSSYVFEAVEDKDEELKIPCNATGIPKPVISWKIEGALIVSNQKFIIKNGYLVINEPEMADSGVYSCEASNGAGLTRATFQVNILQVPVILGKKYSVQAARRGHFANIECKLIKGIPKPTITWQFQAKPFSKFVPIHKTGEVLNIFTVGEAHAGRYKCIASNDIGHDEHLTDFIVEFTPTIVSNSSTIYGIEGDVVLRIPCDAAGVPKPVITWKVDGNMITTPNERYAIINGTLFIRDPVESDSNFYTCEAMNHIGAVYETFKVSVSSKLEDLGTVYEVDVLEGTSFDLECGSDDRSQSVRWYKEKVYTGMVGRFFHFENIPARLEGNYTCHVSDINGTYTETTVVIVGFVPQFENPQEEPVVEWSGTNLSKELDCSFISKPPANVTWSHNGKVLSVRNSSDLVVSRDWGHYTCNVSNIHGAVQRSFNVVSTVCLIRRKPKNVDTKPLILSLAYTWPVLDSTTDYLIVESMDTTVFFCPDYKDKVNFLQNTLGMHEITATCIKQDLFKVDDVLYKLSDFQCAQPVHFEVVIKHEACLGAASKRVRVGYDVRRFLEIYEVCFDVSKSIVLYSRTVMSRSNRGVHRGGNTYNWQKYQALGLASGGSPYTCAYSTSSCCYTKAQLVNVCDVSDGSPQKSTFVDPLNAVPLWLPCAKPNRQLPQSPWVNIEDSVRSRLDSYDQFVVWSGTYKLENTNGNTIPRFLWKVIRFAADDSLAIIYVNGPSPSAEDILCKNICADNKMVPWIHEHDDNTYCCHVDEFLHAFKLSATTVGDTP